VKRMKLESKIFDVVDEHVMNTTHLKEINQESVISV